MTNSKFETHAEAFYLGGHESSHGKASSGTAAPKTNTLITAYIDYCCPMCDRSFTTATTLIKHYRTVHELPLTSRGVGKRRPRSVKYHFVEKHRKPRRTLLGCPSCWFYCPTKDMKALTDHIDRCHLECEEETTETPIDEDEADFYDEVYDVEEETTKNKLISQLEDLTRQFKEMFGY